MNPITTEQATIRTASVEVKTLTLGKKQMTLSVFRQLPCEHIIDPATMTLRGTPWGKVNYFWGDCEKRPLQLCHLHIIWERQGILLRACVEKIIFKESEAYCDSVYPFGDKIAYRHLLTLPTCLFIDNYNHRAFRNDARPEPFERQWNAMYDRLAALDQLFIAV